MARIWYSVCGEGMGHAVRSDSVIEKLKGHEILITAAEVAYPYLKKKYKNVHYIYGNRLVYKNNKVMLFGSVRKFLLSFPYKVIRNTFRLWPLIRKFKPDVIISDFESASHYFARLFRIPCISVDNIHFQTECFYNEPKKPWYTNMVIKFLHPSSSYYIIPNFADIQPKRDNVFLVSPIVRNSVQKQKEKNGDFVLVYQTSPTNKKMIPVLYKFGMKTKIYGMNGKSFGNIEHKKFSEKEFLSDLGSCKFAIINGGFTVLSEALFLNKPILAIPIQDQFEQFFNAYNIRAQGYGDYADSLSVDLLKNFANHVDEYKKNISKMDWDDNTIVIIEKLIKQCTR